MMTSIDIRRFGYTQTSGVRAAGNSRTPVDHDHWRVDHMDDSSVETPPAIRKPGFPARKPIERMLPRISMNVDSGCWEWTGATNTRGYGNVNVDRSPRLTHRVMWEALRGAIPDGLVLDHLCRNPPCCNPAHLEPVTQLENMRRAYQGVNMDRCVHGHEFTDASSYFDPKGRRHCRVCAKAKAARYQARRATRKDDAA